MDSKRDLKTAKVWSDTNDLTSDLYKKVYKGIDIELVQIQTYHKYTSYVKINGQLPNTLKF